MTTLSPRAKLALAASTALSTLAVALKTYSDEVDAAAPATEDPKPTDPKPTDPKPPVEQPPPPATTSVDRTQPFPAPVLLPVKMEVDVADGVAMVPITLSFAPKATVIAYIASINGAALEGRHFDRVGQTLVWQPGDDATKVLAIKVYGAPADGASFGLYMTNVENPGVQPIRDRWEITFRKGAKQTQARVASPPYTPKSYPAPAAAPKWQMDMSAPLVMSDTGLDASGKPCFADRLIHGRTQPGNSEWGYYEPGLPFMRDKELILPAKKLAAPASRPIPNGKQDFSYLSSVIATFKNYVFTYGYMEAEVKTTTQDGTWPAFWALPVDRSWPPELDMFEDPRYKGNNGRTATPNVHWGNDRQDFRYPGRQYDVAAMAGITGRLDTDYHKFGCLWTPDKIVMTLDRKVTLELPNYYGDKPSFMMLDNAVGGWGGQGLDPNNLPWDDAKAEMKVRSWAVYGL